MNKLLWCLGVLWAGITFAAMQSSVSQYGITWTFNQQYECGQFANGDWWVVGPVVINSISPAWDGTKHGWEVNPSSYIKQAFDSRIYDYDATLMPGLPYTAAPGKSIVKCISLAAEDADHNILQAAAVLTVVAAVPPDNGATVFRPPYYGATKTVYSTLALHTELLPALAPVANTPAVATLAASFQRVQLDHKYEWTGRYLHPRDNMPNYGSAMASRNAEGALRLMLNDPPSAKMPLLINYVQMGIDLYAMRLGGETWSAGGGQSVGRKLPLAFAAVLLDDQAMKTAVSSAALNVFQEDQDVYLNRSGVAVYGEPLTSEEFYWHNLVDGNFGSKNQRDPYGLIDGGHAPSDYQLCCVSQPWKGQAIAALIMAPVKTVWNRQMFFDYVDRWVTSGAWTQPDTCAPTDGNWSNYGNTYGTNGHGGCLRDNNAGNGTGRFPSQHGTSKDGGGYGSAFVNSMWTAYRNNLPSGQADPQRPRDGLGSPLRIHCQPGGLGLELVGPATGNAFSLAIYDNQGRVINSFSTLSGSRQIVWKRGDVQTGIYFYVLRTGQATYTGKLVRM